MYVTADEVLVTTGGSEALVFAFMSCLDAGDEVIIPEPFYANYNGFATLAGIKIVPVTARIEDGFSLPPMAEFERAITDRTKAILICNPGNPTGTKYPDSALEALAALVQEKDLFLFADEVYREFTYDGPNARSVLTVPGLEEHAVVVDSVSEALLHVRRAHRCVGDPEQSSPPHGDEIRHGPIESADARANRR